MKTISELLAFGREHDCSDLHLTFGQPPIFRMNGSLHRLTSEEPLTPAQVRLLAFSMLTTEQQQQADEGHDLDFCHVSDDGLRQRVNLFHQQGSMALAIRLLRNAIPSMADLGLPQVISELSLLPRGLVLVTGPTGSGKSTTLAAMIDLINTTRSAHILTVEDPIEYLHTHKKCIVNQREVGVDVDSFAGALRSALREDPDVILVGEMRDFETISAAITAAETGHFVLSTLHTTGAAATIERIIDVFPPHQQQQVRVQLATVLRGVVTQQLLPKADGSGRTVAQEIMVTTDAIANMIRENKCHQINSSMQTGAKLGMHSMDWALGDLLKRNIISPETAMDACASKEDLRRFSGGVVL